MTWRCNAHKPREKGAFLGSWSLLAGSIPAIPTAISASPKPQPAGGGRFYFERRVTVIPYHSRFRADPKKIRVGVRTCQRNPSAERFRASVSEVGGYYCVVQYAETAEEALTCALDMAKEFGLPGIDLDLQWAYRHPHTTEKAP